MPKGIDRLREVAAAMEKGEPLYRQGIKRCDIMKAIKEYDDLEAKYDISLDGLNDLLAKIHNKGLFTIEEGKEETTLP